MQSPKLNKSLSAPDVSQRSAFIRRLCIQDVYKNNQLIRHLSYEEIFGSSCQELDTSECQNELLELGGTPMEIDNSDQIVDTHSNTSDLDIPVFQDKYMSEDISGNSFASENKYEIDSPRHQMRNLSDKKLNVNPFLKSHFSSLSWFCLILICGLVVYVYVANPFFLFNRKAQVENLRADLSTNVRYQDDIVKVVLKTVELMYIWPKNLNVLLFIGTSGVGKTFIANFVKRQFPAELIHEINSQNFDSHKSKVLGDLNKCCCNLIIVEDMVADDSKRVIKFLESVPKDQHALVIAVFSIQEIDEYLIPSVNFHHMQLIEDDFDKSDLYFEVLLFKTLSKEDIKRFVNSELEKRNVEKLQQKKIVSYVFQDDDVLDNGLKRVLHKLDLAIKKYDP